MSLDLPSTITGPEASTPPGIAPVTAIIVSWNTADLLDASIASLRDHGGPPSELAIIVVDNGSTDGSADMVAERWPDVTVIANSENVGFCRANNQAIAVAESPYLLLINADAMLTPGCLTAMVERMRSDPRIGVVGPRLVYGDGRFQRWTAGRAPSLASVGTYLFLLDRISKAIPAFEGTYLGHDRADAFSPDWVSSACMLVRAEMLERVGALDEDIFVYMDDVELCQRARDGRWQVWYEPAGTCIHLMGQSTKRTTGAASPEAIRAFNRYFRDRHGRRKTAWLRGMQAAGFGLRAGAYGVVGAITHDADKKAASTTHLNHLRLCLETTEVHQ